LGTKKVPIINLKDDGIIPSFEMKEKIRDEINTADREENDSTANKRKHSPEKKTERKKQKTKKVAR